MTRTYPTFASTILSGMALLAASQTSIAFPLPASGLFSSGSLFSRQATETTPAQGFHASGWYPSWIGASMTPAQIPWDQYTELTFAFAVTTPESPAVLSLGSPQEEAVLKDFVTRAKENNVDALVSIGGWTGSKYFSQSVGDATNRTIFVNTLTKFATDHQLDGLDFDWEFPGAVGMCNPYRADDLTNFRLFLEEFRRTDVGKNLVLTAAAGMKPWVENGAPSTDVSAFAKLLDRVSIMGYDVHGGWAATKTVGANAPLNAGCPASPDGGVSNAIDDWVAAGIPANQLMLAVPAYARTFTVDKTAVGSTGITTFNPSFLGIPLGEGETVADTSGPDPLCPGDDKRPGGMFTFNALIKEGYLDESGNATSAVTHGYDTCTETPFMYTADGKFISYDDARSTAAKGRLMTEKNLAGFAVWHIGGDSPNSVLLNALHESIGTESVTCGSDDHAPTEPETSPSQSAAFPGATPPVAQEVPAPDAVITVTETAVVYTTVYAPISQATPA